VRVSALQAGTTVVVKLTPERKAAFCAALAASGGNVSRACQAVDIARMTAYEWRDEDPAFAAAWERAKAIGMDALEDEATRRAFEGFDRPIVHQGVITATMREYSDTLAIFLLKGGKPEKYRERIDQNVNGSVTLTVMTGVPDAHDGSDLL
jgi:hypothetical protein